MIRAINDGRMQPVPMIKQFLELREPWMDFYVEAFNDLQTMDAGGGVPWNAVYDYADFHGLDIETTQFLRQCIREIGNALADVAAKKKTQDDAEREASQKN